MRVVLLAADFPPSVGGIQRYGAGLAGALVQAGVPVQVVAMQQPGCERFDAEVGYEVVRVPGGSKRAVWQQMRHAAQSAWPGDDTTAFVALKWFPEGPAALQAAAARRGISAMIGHDREFALHGLNAIKWAMQKWVLSACDIPFATTAFAASQMERMGVASRRLRRLGTGLDGQQFYPDSEAAQRLRCRLGLEDATVVCTVSRLAAHKGHRHVMEALTLIADQLPRLRYLIIGDGPYRPDLERHAEALGASDMVRFTGPVSADDLRAYYTMADVMVMATHDLPGHPTEGFGLSFIEANACGTPVIGTHTGGIPEAIEDGVSGLLVPPCDPETLAEALLSLLTASDYAHLLGEKGRQRALSQFTWPRVVARLIEALDGAQG